MDTTEQVEKVSDIAEIRQCQKTGGKALHASVTLESGQIVGELGAKEILEQPNYLTVQLDEKSHIMLNPEYLQYINHSCAPNVLFDLENKVVKTLRKIDEGEEFTFFYPSTEWSMDRGFDCLCQSEGCLKQIQGAAHLPDHVLNDYQFSPYIQDKLNS